MDAAVLEQIAEIASQAAMHRRQQEKLMKDSAASHYLASTALSALKYESKLRTLVAEHFREQSDRPDGCGDASRPSMRL